jgi:HEPN domain-containing protein
MRYIQKGTPFPKYVNSNLMLYAKIENFINLSLNVLPEHKIFLDTAWSKWKEEYEVDLNIPVTEKKEKKYKMECAISIIEYTLELLELEKSTKSKIAEMKIFESANEKIKEASLSFNKEDYSSVIHNLNTALELLLKDKLNIPTTLTKINTVRIIEILVKEKKGPYDYFSEAKKHVCLVDNKIKHQGYSPTKIDCINSMKVMEELMFRLKDNEIKLSEDVRNIIFGAV